MIPQNTIMPYLHLMRLHQPVGIWLLLWPCWWGLALAGEARIAVYALFALGAAVMRAAGCIINDMADREFDRKVERTKTRPLASGELSMPQALVLLALLLALGLAIAVMLGEKVVWWSLAALPLVALYPFMKRITWWPQLFLGITFNWGALLGWVAVRDTLDGPPLILYAACIFWTLGYDTIYAHQDKEDDAKAGVKSTALRLGRVTKPFVLACYVAFVALFALALRPDHWALWPLALMALHLLWQVATVRLDFPASCRAVFKSNALLGWVPFAAIGAGFLP